MAQNFDTRLSGFGLKEKRFQKDKYHDRKNLKSLQN